MKEISKELTKTKAKSENFTTLRNADAVKRNVTKHLFVYQMTRYPMYTDHLIGGNERIKGYQSLCPPYYFFP